MPDILITIFVFFVIIMLWIMLYDGNRFVLVTYRFVDKRIRKPCRAVVLADVHNKVYGRENERLLEAIRALKPDFIFVAGDMITAKPGKSMGRALYLLGELVKDYPVYYGNGNHEHRLKLYPKTYGTMAEEYAESLRQLGIEPLINARVHLAEYGISVYGAEIDKKYYKRFKVQHMDADYLESVLGKPDKGAYAVLLAHNPDYFPQYAAWGADLVLAGHVHGGVVRIPIWKKGVLSPGVRLFPRYDGGRFDEGNSTMLVSRGLGEHTIPVRIFNPGELLVVDFDNRPGRGEK